MRCKKIGNRYGNLTVIDFLGNKKYLCKCDCGNEIIVKTTELRYDDMNKCTTSCGCKKHVVHKNENFFSNINTEEKAYILGLLAADGNILDSKGSHGFELTLQKQDKSVLEKMKAAMECDATIREYIAHGTFPNGSEKYSEVCRITVYSMQIGTDLVNLGLTAKKSLTLFFDLNKLPDKLIGHFLRGYYDGDGSIICYNDNFKKKKCVVISLIGNYEYLTYLKNYYLSNYGITSSLVDGKKPSGKTFYLFINSEKGINKFLELLYNDSHIYIERKYKKYQEAISLLNKN